MSTGLKIAAAAVLLLGSATLGLASGAQLRGPELVNANGCKGCHIIGEDGGNLGPSLNGVGARLTSEEIRGQLLNPKASNPASIMPAFTDLAQEDLDALVEYLSGLK